MFQHMICPLRKFHMYLRRMCIMLYWIESAIQILLKTVWSKVSLKAIVSLLTFCVDDLSKSSTVIVMLSIPSFRSVNCFIYFDVPHVRCIYSNHCYVFLMNFTPLSLSFIISFAFKKYLYLSFPPIVSRILSLNSIIILSISIAFLYILHLV